MLLMGILLVATTLASVWLTAGKPAQNSVVAVVAFSPTQEGTLGLSEETRMLAQSAAGWLNSPGVSREATSTLKTPVSISAQHQTGYNIIASARSEKADDTALLQELEKQVKQSAARFSAAGGITATPIIMSNRSDIVRPNILFGLAAGVIMGFMLCFMVPLWLVINGRIIAASSVGGVGIVTDAHSGGILTRFTGGAPLVGVSKGIRVKNAEVKELEKVEGKAVPVLVVLLDISTEKELAIAKALYPTATIAVVG